ncbi:hypothetical protein BDR26DRAFT_851397 [Obelidium mucronatum]|nr:hypothetical protein BDR26DRAFT_851397 [Obelidium mucronatum]
MELRPIDPDAFEDADEDEEYVIPTQTKKPTQEVTNQSLTHIASECSVPELEVLPESQSPNDQSQPNPTADSKSEILPDKAGLFDDRPDDSNLEATINEEPSSSNETSVEEPFNGSIDVQRVWQRQGDESDIQVQVAQTKESEIQTTARSSTEANISSESKIHSNTLENSCFGPAVATHSFCHANTRPKTISPIPEISRDQTTSRFRQSAASLINPPPPQTPSANPATTSWNQTPYNNSNKTFIKDSNSIPDLHFQKALNHLQENEQFLAPSAYLITLHSDPSNTVFDQAKAVEWTNVRLVVLGTPEGMLAQARFLRAGKGLMDVKEDMEAALLIRQAAESGYPPAIHAYAIYLHENGQAKESLRRFGEAFEKGQGVVGVGGVREMEQDLEMAVVWRRKVEEYEERLAKEAAVKEREEREEMLQYKEETDYLAYKTHKREESWKRQEMEAKARRDMDGSFASILKYLDWGYYMLAVDELCALARKYLDADITAMPRDQKWSGAAMYAFGEYFAKRSDFRRAVKWFRNAAELDHSEAQITYAIHLVSGEGLPCADPGQSIVWLMKAWATCKHKEAAMALGDAFTKGTGVPADPQKALLWYKRAWEQGRFVEAAFACGLSYSSGYPPGYLKPVVWPNISGTDNGSDSNPVPRSFEKAVYWYEIAARHKHPRACNNLGEMHMMGRGTPQNDFLGLQYFKRAAAEGLGEAMYNIGRSYRDGRGCTRSEETALEWFRRAKEYGAIAESPMLQSQNWR